MTLINEESERRIERILAAVSGSYAVFMIGKDLGQSTLQAIGSALTSRKMTFLEQSFLAGRIASIIGTDKLRRMGQSEISQWILENNVALNEVETATLSSMRRDTERWLQGRSERWQQRFRTAMASADRDWRGVIAAGSFRDAQARTTARNEALNELIEALKGQNESFRGDIDRLLQTEMHSYFQQGQMIGVSGDEEVYKIPRASACPHCMRLHLNPDGSPKIYKLKDVARNSNWGKRASAWQFTIGPVHPYCYCILYRVSDKAPSGPNSRLSSARAGTLRKAAEQPHLAHNECKISADPQTLFEDVLLKSIASDEKPPEYQIKLIDTLKELYGDNLPTLEGQEEKS